MDVLGRESSVFDFENKKRGILTDKKKIRLVARWRWSYARARYVIASGFEYLS